MAKMEVMLHDKNSDIEPRLVSNPPILRPSAELAPVNSDRPGRMAHNSDVTQYSDDAVNRSNRRLKSHTAKNTSQHRFHGVYWPALLLAAGLPPPRQLLCHSHWTVDGQKMSKSLGNVVSATDALSRYTTDGLRYFLLREGVPHSDGNYSERKAVNLLNAELADTLGNLLARCSGSVVNRQQTFPVASSDLVSHHCGSMAVDLLKSLRSLPAAVREHFEQFNFYQGLELVQNTLRATNQFVQQQEPWKLRKDPAHDDQLRCCLHVAMETLRVSGILLQPVVPGTSTQLLDKLGVFPAARSWRDAETPTAGEDQPLGSGSALLFKKLKLV